jgi:hypothetical protein
VTTAHVEQVLAEIKDLRGEIALLREEGRGPGGQPPPA